MNKTWKVLLEAIDSFSKFENDAKSFDILQDKELLTFSLLNTEATNVVFQNYSSEKLFLSKSTVRILVTTVVVEVNVFVNLQLFVVLYSNILL